MDAVQAWVGEGRRRLGLRIPVATILKLLSEGASFPRVLELYPDLEEADLREALAFAARSMEEREIALAS